MREHLLDKRPLSEVCEQYGIAPTQFYQWQKLFFENGAAAFEPKKAGREYELENKVKQLDKKLIKKDEVIAELVEHNIDLKKSMARSKRWMGRAGCPGRSGGLCT
ncbi:MAG TPA: helix-turn-helix domain-containing protein [Anaerohalosphaeraceae bacterium]|nr:helix-turn-helix domain-containing protein [Anaerohalosphaeraceae bacterium]HRS71718.1 helix-turn-helix domain-containing protein [Anaerohalosphaeraceae bacterium]